MRKRLIAVFAIISICLLTGCGFLPEGEEKDSIILPELVGKTYVESIVELNGEISLNQVNVKTNDQLPGKVIGYGGGLKAGDSVEKGMTIDIKIAAKPDNSISRDSKVDFISEICEVTGPTSVNKSLLLGAGIYGTDLGFPVETEDKYAFYFGDSFSSANMKGLWVSNFIATSSKDVDFNKALIFDDVISKPNGGAKPFFEGKHQADNETDRNVEVTKIPTGSITINGTTYIFFMSIRYWGVAGSWNVNYCQCLKSTDLENWSEVSGLRFDEEDAPNFGQVYPFKDPNSNYIYLYGIPGGRSGGCCVARTTEANFENINEYEYKVSATTWKKGSAGLNDLKNNPYYIMSPGVSELTVVYNPYLQKYMTVFYRNGSLTLFTSTSPDGHFSDGIKLLTQEDYNGIYGGLTAPFMLADNGKSFYMLVSCWEVYNVYLVKVVLK